MAIKITKSTPVWCVADTAVHILLHTIDREIFVIDNFRQYSMIMKLKNMNIFQHRIIRTKPHFRYAEAMKIKQCENLTDEYFYERKFPDLRYEVTRS